MTPSCHALRGLQAAQDAFTRAKEVYDQAGAEAQHARDQAAEALPEPQDSVTSDPFPPPSFPVNQAAVRRASISNMLGNLRESATRQIMPAVSKEQLRAEQLARQVAAAEAAQADALAEVTDTETKLQAAGTAACTQLEMAMHTESCLCVGSIQGACVHRCNALPSSTIPR